MKPDKRIAVVLAVGLFAAAAGAQDTQSSTPAPAHHAHQHRAISHRTRFDYQRCVKENLADTEYFCNSHPGAACEAEKKGAVKQCKAEARGVRFSG